jgi:gliding motility-associated-like protein
MQYIVEFLSGTTSIGSSQRASSVFLTTTPSDRRMTLTWTSKTPWNNYKYTIYRKDPATTTFTNIATTGQLSYTDNANIANRNTYCYYISSEGSYSDPGIIKPLINNSQQACALAKDLTPPCSPTLAIDADCPGGYVRVTWKDVKPLCDRSDDVVKYNLFYKPTINEDYKLVASLAHSMNTEYVNEGLTLIAGCYAIQSVDSSDNVSNLSTDFCIDNCPIFELPNIFTPNNDNVNDDFKAIRVRQIKEIDLNVYDRWGNLVYKTKDPYFKWDGISIISKDKVSEGTFFYICDVFEPRLRGIIKRTLKGYVEVAR